MGIVNIEGVKVMCGVIDSDLSDKVVVIKIINNTDRASLKQMESTLSKF